MTPDSHDEAETLIEQNYELRRGNDMLRQALKRFADAHKAMDSAIGKDRYSFSKEELVEARFIYDKTKNLT